jgi:hypothetical protein
MVLLGSCGESRNPVFLERCEFPGPRFSCGSGGFTGSTTFYEPIKVSRQTVVPKPSISTSPPLVGRDQGGVKGTGDESRTKGVEE